jgi:hypothetical protein
VTHQHHKHGIRPASTRENARYEFRKTTLENQGKSTTFLDRWGLQWSLTWERREDGKYYPREDRR